MSSFLPYDSARITAVLGPTNTGKTFLALDRMLGHATGMIGFPLRLLARENYDKIVRLRGAAQVALITGEERIIPPHARWFVCTVESMPVQRSVEFLAVDEIQLCADADRGHIFTDRLLHARGRSETMFLGADTIRPLIQALIPDIEIVTRPRFSNLSYSGTQKLTRLPRRSAIVAFSAQDVYSIAELIRRTKGGAAVVMGALSPRTRNAQVALFQSGEVEHLVATDAIGMGLNMDIDHVAFASLRKFDGQAPRDLTVSEVAQIAGRAGRHMNDGTFGTTTDSGLLPPEVIDLVENHQFPPLKTLFWRNTDLRFTSLEALMGSLNRAPTTAGLLRCRPADDQLALEALARDPEIAGLARGHGRIKLLWSVCSVPDFRKIGAESHARLLASLFQALCSRAGKLSADWVDGHLTALDRVDGDMHAVMERIASIRIWTYISHRNDWLHDALQWQERARAIEDRLSDALHDRLTQRFVDVRTSILSRRLRQGAPLLAAVSTTSNAVTVEGQHVGHLSGLTFVPDASDGPSAHRTVLNAASKALRGEISRRVADLAKSEDDGFALAGDSGALLWNGAEVAQLAPGNEPLQPQVHVPNDDLLDSAARETIRQRLHRWLTRELAERLSPLLPQGERRHGLPEATLTPAVRGLLFSLREHLGTLPCEAVRATLDVLTDGDRAILARLGVRFGVAFLFVPALLKPDAQNLRRVLWQVFHQKEAPALRAGQMSLPVDNQPEDLMLALGYRRLGPRWVRVDVAEKLAAQARQQLRSDTPRVSPTLVSLVGAPAGEAVALLTALGFAVTAEGDGSLTLRRGQRPERRPRVRHGADGKPTATDKTAQKTPERAPDKTPARTPDPAPRKAFPKALGDTPFAGLSALLHQKQAERQAERDAAAAVEKAEKAAHRAQQKAERQAAARAAAQAAQEAKQAAKAEVAKAEKAALLKAKKAELASQWGASLGGASQPAPKPAPPPDPAPIDPAPTDQTPTEQRLTALPVILPPQVIGGSPLRLSAEPRQPSAERRQQGSGKPPDLSVLFSEGTLRLDKWLWFARFTKSRTTAQELCETGKVAVNGTRCKKTAATVKVGDSVTLVLGRQKRSVQVVSLSRRRGPPSEGRLLYHEANPAQSLSGFSGDWSADDDET